MTTEAGNDGTAAKDSGSPLPQTTIELVQHFKRFATEARAVGQDALAAKLERQAKTLEEGTLKNFLDYEREVQASRLRDWEGERRHYRDWHLENLRQVIGLSQVAIRGFTLINAGAIVALLAFIGNVWTKGVVLGPFLEAMWAFALGVILAALAGALSYVTQLLYGAESEKSEKAAKGLHIATIVVGLASLGVFCMGSYRTLDALRQQEVRHAAVNTAAGADRELERRNQPAPKKPPDQPPRPMAPMLPTDLPKPKS